MSIRQMPAKAKRTSFISLAFFAITAGGLTNAGAAGISVDAGLTPPEDRWIIRNQVRYMTREDDPTGMNREMSMYAFPRDEHVCFSHSRRLRAASRINRAGQAGNNAFEDDNAEWYEQGYGA
ncbi:MAG: hypothetical protein ACYSUC_04355 [Planctomycetota bacterium]